AVPARAGRRRGRLRFPRWTRRAVGAARDRRARGPHLIPRGASAQTSPPHGDALLYPRRALRDNEKSRTEAGATRWRRSERRLGGADGSAWLSCSERAWPRARGTWQRVRAWRAAAERASWAHGAVRARCSRMPPVRRRLPRHLSPRLRRRCLLRRCRAWERAAETRTRGGPSSSAPASPRTGARSAT